MMVNNSKINKRFGRLLVIKEAKYSLSQIRKKELWYWCACDCGKKSHLVSNTNLKKDGGTRSCGCLTFDGENKRKKNSDLIIGANVGDLKIIVCHVQISVSGIQKEFLTISQITFNRLRIGKILMV